ncbi:MAG: putative photosynthetic complex assembly protein PuhE [Pseudomonadota bacterium]
MSILLPIASAAACWWLFTILALYRTGLPERTYGSTFWLASAIAMLGVAGLAYSVGNSSSVHAYLAFTSALAIWSWHEITYFLGYVTGPRPQRCPPGLSQWQRFLHGVRACLWHELAVIATAGVIAWMSLGQPNKVGLATFCLLWLMRWSTKLNIFLGVWNFHLEYLPPRLSYLASYMARRRMNPLFPLSVAAGLALVGYWCVQGLATGASDFAVSSSLLLATLTALALLEHIFLMMDVPDGKLWQLARTSHQSR